MPLGHRRRTGCFRAPRRFFSKLPSAGSGCMVAQSGLWLQPRLYPHRCSTGRGARLYPGLAGIACNLSVPRENRFGAEPFEFTNSRVKPRHLCRGGKARLPENLSGPIGRHEADFANKAPPNFRTGCGPGGDFARVQCRGQRPIVSETPHAVAA